jgi:hypothetical protein
MLAGIAGMGALTAGLGPAGPASAAPGRTATTEEWLLGTQGALVALGGAAPIIQGELSAS